MTDYKKNWNVLELNKILERLSGETSLDDVGEMARELEPVSDIFEINERLSQTFAAYNLMARFGAPSFGEARNVNTSLSRAHSGGALSMKELLNIGELLRTIRSLKEWRSNNGAGEKTALDGFFEILVPNKFLEEKIFASIRSEEELYENASPELYDICRKIRRESSSIRERLDKMIRSTSYSKYLQDAIVTMRDGRFVVPVKAEYRASVPGLVHDTSASGATLFVEPAAIVEINNDLRILEGRKQEEIERILSELSVDAGSFATAIMDSYKGILSINFAFTKARLAYSMKAEMPLINTEGHIYLKNARHPLLNKDSVVPITVKLGYDYDTLVITGPNTGGKTVSIKTIGLLTLMTMCGLMIPVDDGSEISVFENVLADIGDEQSIEQSLSTFSSHMKNIVSIIENANDSSLILIDELGSGTDPVEGAALAESIITRLREIGAKVVATTHYAELKSYALDTDGVENGSCEFDVETLKPTYRLITGIPGRSNAFAISERLGLSKAIVDNARALVSNENQRFENVVSSLESARRQAEKERAEAQSIRSELENVKRSNAKSIDEFNRQRDKIIESAKDEARRIIEQTRASSNQILNELDDMKKQARKSDRGEVARMAKAAAKSGLDKMESSADPVDKRADIPYELPRELKPGDTVLLTDINKEATVLKLIKSKNQVEVQAGIFKSKVNVSNLRLIENSNKVTVSGRKITGAPSRSGETAQSEVDLRGMAADEAILELDRYIDHAVIGGIPSIRIIHGKGTGVLRQAVQDYLRRHKRIKSFRLGVYGEGESGVTIAEIK